MSSYDYPVTGIAHPGPHDILCGRGGGTNAHPGNIKFRKLVAAHKLRYLAASKSDKPGVAREVVKEWRNLNPPGRFLAKMEEYGSNNNNQQMLWYDVGDKKAREKASQCLRERNGAANEAVQALVKTVTANGEACPEDYTTLMNKAAMVKARNDVALQQQKEMLSQMSQMADSGRNLSMGGGDFDDNPQPYGLSEQVLKEYSNNRSGSGNGGSFNEYSNQGSINKVGFNQQQQFQQHSNPYQGQMNQQHHQQQMGQNSNQFQGQMNSMNSNFQSEDEVIEAEIQRLLKAKQAQLAMAQTLNNPGSNNMGNSSNNMRGGMTNMGGERGGGFNNPQPYMGEDMMMKEYMQRMQKQYQLNMNNSGMNNGIGNMSGFNGMATNNMNNPMNNVPQNNLNSSDEMYWMSQMAFNNNNNFRNNMGNNMMGNSIDMQNGGSNFSPNNDAARNYLNRLRGKGNSSNQGAAYSGGGNNPDNAFSSEVSGRPGGTSGQTDGRGFAIEEYQAALQEFLANDGDNKARNDSSSHEVFEVPTNLGDSNTIRKRDSMQSIGTFARNTFQSVDSNCHRKSFESVDDMDDRPTFKSIDTMDMMSITNSVNDIIDDDIIKNPEVREIYERRMSRNSDIDGKFEVATFDIKTKEGSQGNGRPKKVDAIEDKIDPRLLAMAGARQTVQTKQKDGPGRTEKRSSMASVDTRLSFANSEDFNMCVVQLFP